MPTFCFPVAQGVPGQPGGPNWYDNSAAPPSSITRPKILAGAARE